MKCLVLCVLILASVPQFSSGACTPCNDHEAGVSWGTVRASAISEASGIASSRRNPGVLWTHNDGARERIFAVATNGALLGTYNFGGNVDDLEDIAVGPGPMVGVSYLYIGDIGGDVGVNTTRSEVRVVRAPEPRVDLAFATTPVARDLSDVDIFTLQYPDGSYDTEALLIDPQTLDAILITKDPASSRVYRANVAGATNRAVITLEYVSSITFTNVSGGTISHDGSQILLRREDAAALWARCQDQSVADALAGLPESVPVIGPPTELNGEAISFLSAGSGYVTISEGDSPSIYFFHARCAAAPQFTLKLTDQSGFAGGEARFEVMAVGYPEPSYTWRFKGEIIPGQQNAWLALANLSSADAGNYEVTASNEHSSATSTAALTVRPKPDLRITEVLANPAPNQGATADWWELTSFEDQPVNLSGWRFNDNAGGLTDPFTLPDGITIAPRESIVFAETITAAQFRSWWGNANVPSTLQIISYGGNGLGLGANGDGLRLWNGATTDPADTVASVDFGASGTGVSFNFDPITGQFGARSVLGVNGVVRAAVGTDIGSPGRIVAPATSPILEVTRLGDVLRIAFDAAVGHRYALEARASLSDESWTATGDIFDATTNTRHYFEKSATGEARFFRVVVE